MRRRRRRRTNLKVVQLSVGILALKFGILTFGPVAATSVFTIGVRAQLLHLRDDNSASELLGNHVNGILW